MSFIWNDQQCFNTALINKYVDILVTSAQKYRYRNIGKTALVSKAADMFRVRQVTC